MIRFATSLMNKLDEINKETWQNFGLRIGIWDREFLDIFKETPLGIDVGPLIAGVLGVSKPHYDIWGDTVNVASRMDSNGQMGKIHVRPMSFCHRCILSIWTFRSPNKSHLRWQKTGESSREANFWLKAKEKCKPFLSFPIIINRSIVVFVIKFRLKCLSIFRT